MLIVYTGNGKGKTTAALGLMLRAWGHGLAPCVIQFLKDEQGRWGETLAAERLDIPWYATGAGYTFTTENLEHDRELAQRGWQRAQELIASGAYDLVILDEFTYVLAFGWLALPEVLAWLVEHATRTDIVITGRSAPAELVAAADLVTEMQEVRHPYYSGVEARKGIEF
ncbi:MAG: cob(I)yrinic acid a,c-diamide adenosyltransferase [Anaerolineae bacterium]|jgi:cob(I)alamin adenosyltransferase|nr:cob(I)yrinic acid a,c-diamide adenosyltransferase [Chloroflexota bacterium]